MFRKVLPALALVSCVLHASACASSGASRAPGSSDRITSAEISKANATNAYELINRLRPSWLRVSGAASIGGGIHSPLILVYIDNQRAEDLSALKTVSTSVIASAQWIDAARVATVLGNVPPGSYSGAILIKTH